MIAWNNILLGRFRRYYTTLPLIVVLTSQVTAVMVKTRTLLLDRLFRVLRNGNTDILIICNMIEKEINKLKKKNPQEFVMDIFVNPQSSD